MKQIFSALLVASTLTFAAPAVACLGPATINSVYYLQMPSLFGEKQKFVQGDILVVRKDSQTQILLNDDIRLVGQNETNSFYVLGDVESVTISSLHYTNKREEKTYPVLRPILHRSAGCNDQRDRGRE